MNKSPVKGDKAVCLDPGDLIDISRWRSDRSLNWWQFSGVGPHGPTITIVVPRPSGVINGIEVIDVVSPIIIEVDVNKSRDFRVVSHK